MKNCELCQLSGGDIKTRLYYQDKKIIIVDCLTCKIPMGVWREHKKELTPEERLYLVEKMQFTFGIFGDFREPRKILNHYHLHFIRGKGRRE